MDTFTQIINEIRNPGALASRHYTLSPPAKKVRRGDKEWYAIVEPKEPAPKRIGGPRIHRTDSEIITAFFGVVCQSPGITRNEIGRQVNILAHTFDRVAKILLEAGVVRYDRKPHSMHWHVVPGASIDSLLTPPNTKKCPKCSTIKPLEDFNRDSGKLDGRQSYCRKCAALIHLKRKGI